jgi:hypothetical protein
MVLAEKIVTAMERGTANTRWRDLADVYLLTSAHTMPAEVVRKAIQVVAEHRNVTLRPLREVHDGYADLGQAKWAAWRHKQQLDGALPQRLGEVLSAIWAFTDPLVERDTGSQTWHTDVRQWA